MSQLIAIKEVDHGPGKSYKPRMKTHGLYYDPNDRSGKLSYPPKTFYLTIVGGSNCSQTWVDNDFARKWAAEAGTCYVNIEHLISLGDPKMNLSKSLENAVCFAQWCINNKLDPRQVGELRTLVNRHANTWCRQNNQEIEFDRAEKKMEKLTTQINELAVKMGIADMDWPGLYPTFTTPAGFRNSMLPEV